MSDSSFAVGAVAAPKIVGMVDGAEQVLFGWDTPAAGGEYEVLIYLLRS